MSRDRRRHRAVRPAAARGRAYHGRHGHFRRHAPPTGRKRRRDPAIPGRAGRRDPTAIRGRLVWLGPRDPRPAPDTRLADRGRRSGAGAAAGRHGMARKPFGAQSPAEVAEYLAGRATARELPPSPPAPPGPWARLSSTSAGNCSPGPGHTARPRRARWPRNCGTGPRVPACRWTPRTRSTPPCAAGRSNSAKPAPPSRGR